MARYFLTTVLLPEGQAMDDEMAGRFPEGTLFAGDWIDAPATEDEFMAFGQGAGWALGRKVNESGWPKMNSEDDNG